jgi:hypothetical protein
LCKKKGHIKQWCIAKCSASHLYVNTPPPSIHRHKQAHCSQVYIYTYTEGKIGGTGRKGRRRKQLLDDLKETVRYWKLKEEARTCRKTDYVMMMLLVVVVVVVMELMR